MVMYLAHCNNSEMGSEISNIKYYLYGDKMGCVVQFGSCNKNLAQVRACVGKPGSLFEMQMNKIVMVTCQFCCRHF